MKSHMIGLYWRKAVFILLLVFVSQPVFSQTFILKPIQKRDSFNNWVTAFMLKRNAQARSTWSNLDNSALNLTGRNAKLIIGRTSNTYDFLAVDVTGTNYTFVPDNIGLPPGRYYARITNSTARTAEAIQADFNANPTTRIYSNEVLVIVEANQAPSITAPRGVIQNSTPTFQWLAVPGVVSYWVIVSSTPFQLTTNENDEISISGATVVWQIITNSTSVEYGEINYDSPYVDEARPLSSGQEYSYTVLNVYEENNPVFASPVFGGVIPFTYVNPNALPKANLVSPLAEAEFFAQPTVTFRWDPVPGASNYTINLFQLVKQQGVNVTVPIWSSTTTNTIIDFDAISSMKNGRYQWNVTTNNTSGGGTQSDSRFFTYNIPTGAFTARIQNAIDNTALIGVELYARSTSGGVTPLLPFLVQQDSYADSLVAGTYEFEARKTGFRTQILTNQVIRNRQNTPFTIRMQSLPSSIQGTVRDEKGAVVSAAEVTVRNATTNAETKATTNSSGGFNVSISEGTYSIVARKTGYISSTARSITLTVNQQRTLQTPLVITNDQATVSGTIVNEDGGAVQLATITIYNANNSFETKSNGSGFYQFNVTSGNWSIKVERTGFVNPDILALSLTTGEVLQNQNFVMVGNANQIVGFVRQRVTNADGTTGLIPFPEIEVIAVPSVGTPISSRTALNGQYSMSLKAGSYTLKAERQNYTTSQDRELVIGIAVGETIAGLDFELIPNPSSVSGTVVLPNGNGINEVTVTVPGVGSTLTNSAGVFTLSVPEGSRTIRVSKTGHASPEEQIVSVAAGQNLTGLRFQMSQNAATISGSLTSEGQPLANTNLFAVNRSANRVRNATSAADGSYSFSIQPGTWYIRAERTGFLTDSTANLTVGPGQTLVSQNITLIENTAQIRGTITDGSQPLRNVRVTLTTPSDPTFTQSTNSQVTGTYAFVVTAGRSYVISTNLDGYGNKSSTTASLVPKSLTTADFALSANPSSVAGTVTVDGVAPLGNVYLVAINASGQRIDSVITRSNGNYLLGLNPGTYTLEAYRRGYTPGSKQTTLQIGQNVTGINFTLPENFAFITGTVKDGAGNAIEQALVNLTRNVLSGSSTITDQNGLFSINRLIGGTVTITISKEGFDSFVSTISIRDGQFLDLNPILTAKDGAINGTVRDKSGNPLAEATVEAIGADGNNYLTTSDSDGAYSFTQIGLTEYNLGVSLSGFTSEDPVQVTLTPLQGTLTDVLLNNVVENNAVITGIVLNNSSSQPIQGVTVSASGATGSGFALTGSDGRFRIENLAPSTYRVVAQVDGYRSDSTTVTTTNANPTVNHTFRLIQNNGIISGRVLTASNTVLSFRPFVVLTSLKGSIRVQTNANGNFSFENVETGLSYTLATDIFREGYSNVQTTVNYPLGQPTFALSSSMLVPVSIAKINGNVQEADVTVRILNATTRAVVKLLTSRSDGSYEATFLSQGNYRVSFSKPGFRFSPDTTETFSLAFDATATRNATATPNIGRFEISARRGTTPLSNVDVSLVSSDTSIVRTAKTNSQGLAVFADVPATRQFFIRPSIQGFTPDSAVKTRTLAALSTNTVVFTFSANNSSMAGEVRFNTATGSSPLNQATVNAILTSTGQTFSATTNAQGRFSLPTLPAGTYRLISSRTGYIADTLNNVTLNPGQNRTLTARVLAPSVITIRGTVRYNGAGVANVDISAVSTSTLTTKTAANGSFQFENIPASTNPTDTTVYQIQYRSGLFSRSTIVRITANQVGGPAITLPVVNLPSGQINLLVSNGFEPLDGVRLTFGISGGNVESIITDETGAYASAANLRSASYVVSLQREGYMIPERTIQLQLATDTSKVNRTIYLPYVQQPVSQILADQPTLVKIYNVPQYNNSRSSGRLFYKTQSESQFSTVNLTRTSDSLYAFIPALETEEDITFYSVVNDTSRNNIYRSSQLTVKPLASGILKSIRINPSIDQQTLRKGDSFSFRLVTRDGVNNSLADKFLESGTDARINWRVLAGADTSVFENQNGVNVQFKADSAGAYRVQAIAFLNGSEVIRTVNVNVTEIPLEQISVSRPGPRARNTASHLFSFSAFDTTNTKVLLGNSTSWSVVPAEVGSVDSTGLFTPADVNTIGSFRVRVSDSVSEISGLSDVVDLFAVILPTQDFQLSDNSGMELSIPAGSVSDDAEISVRKTQPEKIKKFVFAQGTEDSYTVSETVYSFNYSGSDLNNPISLRLPVDNSLSLFDGERQLGRFDTRDLEWEIITDGFSPVGGAALGGANSVEIQQTEVSSTSITEFGQFAVLVANKSLGIDHAVVLPTPFSPDVAPAKIGYFLSTAFPPAQVSITIFNMRGELVRNLLENDLQQPGAYGSAIVGAKEISWDGKTNSGDMVRNGRYVIEIKAKDQEKEVKKLIQIVVIK